MICPNCNKTNRDKAIFCKWCGKPVTITGPCLSTLICKGNIPDTISKIITDAVATAENGRKRGIDMRLMLSFAITGPAGVGKSYVAEAITVELQRAGIIKSPKPTIVKAAEYDKFVESIDKNIKSIGGNVLIIDEAQKLCPSSKAEQTFPLDKILTNVKDWCKDAGKPIVIFVGDDQLKDFFDNNPQERAKVRTHIEVPKPDIKSMTEMAVYKLSCKKCTVNDEARSKIERVLTASMRRDLNLFNCHVVEDIVCSILTNPEFSTDEVTPEIITGEEFIPKTLEQVMEKFDKYVGVDEIKDAIREIAATVEDARAKGIDPNGAVDCHFVFKGNPGTGKTTMARLFAEALQAMGALSGGQIIEVDREKLVSNFVGETPKLVRKAVRDAIDGVLFIDEAYALCTDKDDKYGMEVVNTLLKDCEDLRGKFVCLLAGYPIEMDRFLSSNPGLQRRFSKTINFRDYTGSELTQIFINMATKGDHAVTLADEVHQQIGSFFDKMYKTRDNKFGNAGTVRNTLNDALSRMRIRIKMAKENGSYSPDMDNVMLMCDIEQKNNLTVEEILASFDDLVGMDSVKTQIRNIAQSVKKQKALAEKGLIKDNITNVHIILTGNPGTGKTTVAQRLGQVFHAIGIIKSDRVVIKKAEDIFDSYQKSAGPNMKKAIDDAMGGVLFIDEAYNLLPVTTPGVVDASGSEAVNALLTGISENPGRFVTVLAGYKNEMDEFMRNANDGLQDRFTHSIHIPDYSAESLITIFLQQVKKSNFEISDDGKERLRLKIEEIVATKDEKFGNARTIIELFNKTKERHFNNINLDTDTDERLRTICAEDIPYDAPKKLDIGEILVQLDHLDGLESVKEAVRELAKSITIQQMRNKVNGNNRPINLDHYLFLGNPGTGKTTVARIMGQIFYSLGLLPSDKVIELSAKDLKATTVGTTAPKTHDALMRGMGGVVFIDEAYSITMGDGNVGYGQEAVAEILQVMENYRNRFILIAAGYPREMREWLDTNSGLRSRFSKTIMFNDYTAEELTRIAKKILENQDFKVTEAAETAMHDYFVNLTINKSKDFANAREARNFVKDIIGNHNSRLFPEWDQPDNNNKEKLNTIELSDIK